MKRHILYGVIALTMCGNAHAHVWDELAILARPNADGTFTLDQYSFLQPTTYTNAVFFDFDNDENLDLLVMGQGGDWNISGDLKFVTLYRNLGAEENYRLERIPDAGFLQARDEGFYNPISTGDFNHDGYTDVVVMNYRDGRHIDLYLNDKGTGRFIRQNITFEGATNGSVMFGDLNNDGWLDIEYSGYSDRTSTALKTYINQKDGTFADRTPAGISGAFQGQSTLADIDGNGTIDIISTGNGDNWSCLASIYYNTIADGIQTYRYVPETESCILGASRANPLVVDLNADGRMDMVVNGEPDDGSGFRTRIYYQDEAGKFKMDVSYPVVPVNQDGGINMGDWNGDGNMDLIVGGYIGTLEPDAPACYSSPLRVYENRPEQNGLKSNTIPDAPDRISAEIQNDEMVITWNDGADTETPAAALRYNLFVRNEDTGETYTMIPADRTSGKLKVGTDLQTSLSSSVKTYRLRPFGQGLYTVGVQTLDQAYAGSPFKTCTLTVTTAVTSASLGTSLEIARHGLNIKVKSDRNEPVKIYTPDGMLVSQGITNEPILLPARGIYLVAAGPRKGKIIL
ncbi:MAG: VCBS repeat-containing protein [Paraprevotella sp.]|nr:VCBS repeat-containing protein [Paraprevotella sp.]